jgi:hypothetical protein
LPGALIRSPRRQGQGACAEFPNPAPWRSWR